MGRTLDGTFLSFRWNVIHPLSFVIQLLYNLLSIFLLFLPSQNLINRRVVTNMLLKKNLNDQSQVFVAIFKSSLWRHTSHIRVSDLSPSSSSSTFHSVSRWCMSWKAELGGSNIESLKFTKEIQSEIWAFSFNLAQSMLLRTFGERVMDGIICVSLSNINKANRSFLKSWNTYKESI